MESNQIDVVAATVFRDLEELDHILETRTSRQVWGDLGQTDRPNRIHFDLTLIHAVAPASLDVGTCPYSDTASDGASSHSFSEPLGEDHAASLRLGARLREQWVPPEFLSAQRMAFTCGAEPRQVQRRVARRSVACGSCRSQHEHLFDEDAIKSVVAKVGPYYSVGWRLNDKLRRDEYGIVGSYQLHVRDGQ